MVIFLHLQKGAVTKVVTVVKTKKVPQTHKKKGELMENDQDAMEVSNFICLIAKINLLKNMHSLVRPVMIRNFAGR